MSKMNEMALYKNAELRERCIDRIEVLDKVKQLFLIPEMMVATTKMVAEYFEVEVGKIESCYIGNKNEIDPDGVIARKQRNEFLGLPNKGVKTMSGKAIIKLQDNITLEVPNRGLRTFSKRAILRIAMLLQGSIVAKEIRTQLLNTFESSTAKQRTTDIDEEKLLIADVVEALINENSESALTSFQRVLTFQKRHVAKLQKDYAMLAGEIRTWSDRSLLNRGVRVLTNKICKLEGQRYQYRVGQIWNEFYDELLYKYGIHLKKRGGKDAPYIQYIKDDEWDAVSQCFNAFCEKYGYYASTIYNEAQLKSA